MRKLILRSFRRAAVLCFLSVLMLPLALTTRAPQIARYVREHYSKYEFHVPMRDGTRLLTSVYVPKDESRKYPIMLSRTPYSAGPYGAGAYPTSLGPSDLFTADGFIFAYQDVRGRWMSGGEFVNARPICADQGGTSCVDESTDTYDTIEWLLENVPNHNSRVGMWGVSYPGFYASAGVVTAHPSLKAVSPQAPVTEWFLGDDIHHNGALSLSLTFSFFNSFGRPRPTPTTKALPPVVTYPSQDGYRFYLDIGPLANVNARYFKNQIPFWNDLMAHPNYDAFWQSRDVRRHLTHITPAVMTVGGWFDNQDLFGALETYKTIARNSAGVDNRLIMGPWYHGGWVQSDGEGLGPVRFGARTGKFYREQIEFPFFAHFLKDRPDFQPPHVYVFNTGRNEWSQFDTWPPKTTSARSLYLHAGGRLSLEASAQAVGGAYDEYVSDPGRPVPFVGEVVQNITREYMVADQRFAATRPDVLVYQTDVLTQDVTIAGPIRPSLVVSTSGTDSDWVVKLIDVYPDNSPSAAPTPHSPSTNVSTSMGGYQQLVRGEVMRGRFRSSYENPKPFVPGMPTTVEYAMPDVFHTFRRGHRIMIQIQSSWFPLFDRNPQTFVNINTATAADFHTATERVYHAPGQQSKIEVAVLK